MTDRFDWNTDDSVVVRPQAAIAVARGPDGEVMLRQEGQHCISEDQFIDVRPEHVVAVCKAMLSAAGLHTMMIVPVDEIGIVGRDGNRMTIPADEFEKIDRISEELWDEERTEGRPARARTLAKSKDATAAERQRRRRAKRDTVTETVTVTPATVTSSVTDRDCHGVTVDVTPGPAQPYLKLAHG